MTWKGVFNWSDLHSTYTLQVAFGSASSFHLTPWLNRGGHGIHSTTLFGNSLCPGSTWSGSQTSWTGCHIMVVMGAGTVFIVLIFVIPVLARDLHFVSLLGLDPLDWPNNISPWMRSDLRIPFQLSVFLSWSGTHTRNAKMPISFQCITARSPFFANTTTVTLPTPKCPGLSRWCCRYLKSSFLFKVGWSSSGN